LAFYLTSYLSLFSCPVIIWLTTTEQCGNNFFHKLSGNYILMYQKTKIIIVLKHFNSAFCR